MVIYTWGHCSQPIKASQIKFKECNETHTEWKPHRFLQCSVKRQNESGSLDTSQLCSQTAFNQHKSLPPAMQLGRCTATNSPEWLEPRTEKGFLQVESLKCLFFIWKHSFFITIMPINTQRNIHEYIMFPFSFSTPALLYLQRN